MTRILRVQQYTKQELKQFTNIELEMMHDIAIEDARDCYREWDATNDPLAKECATYCINLAIDYEIELANRAA